MIDAPLQIGIKYDPVRLSGILERKNESDSAIWERLQAKIIADNLELSGGPDRLEIPWTSVLGIIREFGSKSQQQGLNFRFAPEGEASEKIKSFVEDVQKARAARNKLVATLSQDEITAELIALGFTKRTLTQFQLENVQHLVALPHGADFSVPGAGKTTVAFALHLLVRKPDQHLFVVCPRSAFPAWKDIISECVDDTADENVREPFTILDGKKELNEQTLRSGATRFLMSYDLMVRQAEMISAYMARQPVHLILDESHRMKAGLASQRGAYLLGVAGLPVRRDILSGTPMPQGPDDLAAQLGFLWPGVGYGLQIVRGVSPRQVLGELYVRTTKSQLGIPPAHRHYHDVKMADGQLALYGIVRNEALRQLKNAVTKGQGDFDTLRARRSVMRLLQLSTNPVLALQGITESVTGLESGIVDQVLLEGPSAKMRGVEDHARLLAKSGKKVVIWTIFTDTLLELERMLIDLNPVTLYGAVPSGDKTDLATREGRLRRFHIDDACQALIANPAAAGEGISLHTVCHEAIYVDRSYSATHYLQSIDRIHRLGLPQNIETNIHIYRTKAPPGLGSIDYSVSRRLALKIRALQSLLNDPDLHQIAFDEESADDPIDYDVKFEDLVDLIEELEGRGIGAEEDGDVW